MAIENINKIAIIELAKMLSIINFDNKHDCTISNSNINIAGNLKLTNIQKYQKCNSQIQK